MAIAKSRTNPVSHVEFPALDGLRALAVTAVFIYHAALGSKTLTEHAADVVVHFDTGVQIFFVLSGFLIYRPFAAAHLAGRRVGMVQSYARRRAMRIYPAYWLALGVLLLIGTVTVANGWMLLANLTLTQTYFERFPQGLPQAWSLVVEVSFYVFVPLFAVLVRAVGARVGAWRAEIGGALMCIALGYLAVWAQTLEPPLALQVLPPALATLGAGMLLAVLTLSAPHAPRLVPTLQRWAQRVWPWWIGAGLFFGWQVARRYGYFDLTRQQHMGDDMLRVPGRAPARGAVRLGSGRRRTRPRGAPAAPRRVGRRRELRRVPVAHRGAPGVGEADHRRDRGRRDHRALRGQRGDRLDQLAVPRTAAPRAVPSRPAGGRPVTRARAAEWRRMRTSRRSR